MRNATVDIDLRRFLELEKLAQGVFAPLGAFMDAEELDSVSQSLRLPDGQVFPLPVIFDLPRDAMIGGADRLRLRFQGEEVAELTVRSVYRYDKEAIVPRVFGTADTRHPGVRHQLQEVGETLAAGPVRLLGKVALEFSEHALEPARTRAYFAERGWRTVVGFQTRNVPHRAHEYLLRLALEQYDGLFVQPLVGRKQSGDYTPEAILAGYRALLSGFLPRGRVLLGVLSTYMRYAGPREAVFHALMRRNYGCTHFIVGRDHAGVGGFYGPYDAHRLLERFEGELGIAIVKSPGPYHCRLCDGIVTDRSCPHRQTDPGATRAVDGTAVRQALRDGRPCPPEFMRPEILAVLRGLRPFIERDEP